MKFFISTVATAATLSILPASADSAPNSHTRTLTPQTHSITVDGSRNDDRSDVMDEALYEAALATLDGNHTWFRVIKTEVDREVKQTRANSSISSSYERVPVQSCSLLGCSTQYQTRFKGSSDIGTSNRESVQYTVNLKYQMLQGDLDYDEGLYNASIVKRTYE